MYPLAEGLSGHVAYNLGERGARVGARWNNPLGDTDLEGSVGGVWLQKDSALALDGAVNLNANNRVAAT